MIRGTPSGLRGSPGEESACRSEGDMDDAAEVDEGED